MTTKKQEMQFYIRRYKEITRESEVDMRKVADFMIGQGWTSPKPASPRDILARELAHAAREEYRKDEKTGLPYRANHALRRKTSGGDQMTLWIDIDEATRPQMHQSLTNRRDQMVGDGYLLTLDAEHWNRANESEEPIQLEMDLTPDIEWRKNAPMDDAA